MSHTAAAATSSHVLAQSPYATGTEQVAVNPGNVAADADRDAGFADWIGAEAAAYGAVHMLHQRTCGGRLKASSADIEEIARLRREADDRFAMLRGAPEADGVDGARMAARQPLRVRAHRVVADACRIKFAGANVPGALA